MTVRIAVCGKGGVGKTTIVCGIVKCFLELNHTPILVVDADPNSNLAENLGVTYTTTVADIREELRNVQIPSNISKSDYFLMRLQDAVVEHKGFDLIVMGRPEGRECYCFVNELLRTFLSNLSKNYKFVVIDTEAGMEHLSRRTTDNIDHLIVVATPTKVAMDTAKKIIKLTEQLKLKILNKKVVLNMADSKNFSSQWEIDFVIHKDNTVENYSQQGLPLLENIINTNFYKEIKLFCNTFFNPVRG
ncbi:MAG: AAA family ATPase [Endomicrobia bacterium]|nr:AAA family ATPase [Endomicrobiia bacterium]MDW8056290.1 AAA family ATPase [Elusimicrobiota bacterium]